MLYNQIVFYLPKNAMLRYGKPVADKLESEIKKRVSEKQFMHKYIAIIMI